MNRNSEVSAVKERLKDIFQEKENESESLACKKEWDAKRNVEYIQWKTLFI